MRWIDRRLLSQIPAVWHFRERAHFPRYEVGEGQCSLSAESTLGRLQMGQLNE